MIEGKSALVTGSTRGIAPGVTCARRQWRGRDAQRFRRCTPVHDVLQ
jgi:hypothetical protein